MKRSLGVLGAMAAVAVTFTSHDADACGGCFVGPSESTVVTGHRMAFSVSPAQTVLWDQIQYAGNPADFSWVLPVKPGAYVEVAADAFFDVLETGTAVTVGSPPEGCASGSSGGGFGCGSSDESAAADFNGKSGSGPDVQVIHEGTVGPYETVTLSSQDPNALAAWLEMNGYDVPDGIQPVIDAYVGEGFDFIALKLQPGKNVQQMKPVRVVTPGSGPVLPLRMVAAGVGANVGIVLFVIGEGRYQVKDFANDAIESDLVSWDFEVDRSNYAELRLATLSANGGRTWLTSYAQPGGLLQPVADPTAFMGAFLTYTIGDPNVPPYTADFAETMAEAYVYQGIDNGEETTGAVADDCIAALDARATSGGVVVDPCDDQGNCGTVGSGEIDMRQLACGDLDDVAVALVGLHPKDVHVTRLEASLPVAALDTDLVLEASDDQSTVQARFIAGIKLNACWDSSPAGSVWLERSPPRIPPQRLVLLTMTAAALYLAARRLRPARAITGR
jgi:uncharacterized protein DUF2330